jgi:hypothetical protein
VGWGLLVALITLVPGAEGSLRTSEPVLCLVCGSRGSADAILNVVFFMPLGFLLRPRFPLATVAFVGFALSGTVELIQELVPGRYPTLGDLVWNGTGCLLGAIGCDWLRRELGDEPVAMSKRAGAVAVTLPVIYLLGAGLLLQPLPTDAAYYGQWTADLDFMPVYGGRALEIETHWGGLPDGPMGQPGDPRFDPSWFVAARIVKGPPPRGPAPIASIYDAEKREIALLGAHGEDLLWREWTRASVMRFDSPDRRFLGGLLPHPEGDTIRIAARGDAEARCLVVEDREDCGGGLSPGRTWGLLLFLEGTSESRRTVLDIAWMATLSVLIGVLGGGLRRTLVLGSLTALGILGAVAATRLGATPAAEWAGFAGGIAAGVVLRPFLRHLVEGEGRDPAPLHQPDEVGVDATEFELP